MNKVSQEEREDARKAAEYLREHGVEVTWTLIPSPPHGTEGLLGGYIETYMMDGLDERAVIAAIEEDYGLAEE